MPRRPAVAEAVDLEAGGQRSQQHVHRRDGAEAYRSRRGQPAVLGSLALVANLAVEDDGESRQSVLRHFD